MSPRFISTWNLPSRRAFPSPTEPKAVNVGSGPTVLCVIDSLSRFAFISMQVPTPTGKGVLPLETHKIRIAQQWSLEVPGSGRLRRNVTVTSKNMCARFQASPVLSLSFELNRKPQGKFSSPSASVSWTFGDCMHDFSKGLSCSE